MPSGPPLAARTGGVFRAVVTTIVPEAARLDGAQWAELETIVRRFLARRPAHSRRQLAVLLALLDWLPVLRYGRRLTALDPRRRARFLALVEDAPLLLVRRGFWGLRTLAFLGYYGRPEAAAAIGSRADPRGWDARR